MNQTTKEALMTEKATTKEKGVEALYNLGAKKLGQLVALPAGALVGRHLAKEDESLRGRISTFLQGDVGQALVVYLIGLALEVRPLPHVVAANVQTRLAHACQVKGMEGGLEVLVDVVWQPLMEIINASLRAVELLLPVVETHALENLSRETTPESVLCDTAIPVEHA